MSFVFLPLDVVVVYWIRQLSPQARRLSLKSAQEAEYINQLTEFKYFLGLFIFSTTRVLDLQNVPHLNNLSVAIVKSLSNTLYNYFLLRLDNQYIFRRVLVTVNLNKSVYCHRCMTVLYFYLLSVSIFFLMFCLVLYRPM